MRPLYVYLAVIAVIAALGGVLYVSHKSVEADVVAAIERNDVAALAARVDFDALRVFLKDDIRQKKSATGPLAAQMANAGPSMDKIDAVVDYYVQPDNIAILYAMRQSAAEGIPVQKFIVARGYAPVFGFSLTLGAPPELLQDSAARTIADRYRVRVVFRLSGLTWKIAELHAPPSMMPKAVYSQSAREIFAPNFK